MRSCAIVAALALWVGPALAAKPAPKAESSCSGDYGTNVLFEETPQEAAKRAAKEEKLVMVLHVSGHFEDPALT